jgi:hypothetical protein
VCGERSVVILTVNILASKTDDDEPLCVSCEPTHFIFPLRGPSVPIKNTKGELGTSRRFFLACFTKLCYYGKGLFAGRRRTMLLARTTHTTTTTTTTKGAS